MVTQLEEAVQTNLTSLLAKLSLHPEAPIYLIAIVAPGPQHRRNVQFRGELKLRPPTTDRVPAPHLH